MVVIHGTAQTDVNKPTNGRSDVARSKHPVPFLEACPEQRDDILFKPVVGVAKYAVAPTGRRIRCRWFWITSPEIRKTGDWRTYG